MTSLSNARANEIVRRAITRATELDIAICVAIVDAGGHMVAFQRMDGAMPGAVDVSQRKARTAALFPLPSGDFGQLIADQQLIGMELTNGGIAAFHGGLPVQVGDSVFGAIGISGGSAEQDLEIAHCALTSS